MTTIHDRFEAVNSEYGKFENIVNPRNSRPDLCAFMVLHSLQPNNDDMISSAEHDIIFLNVDVNDLNKVIGDDDLLTLVRCGISYDSSFDCLTMFV